MMFRTLLPLAGGMMIALASLDAGAEPPKHFKTLRIGAASSVMAAAKPDQKDAAKDTLKDFIKKETGFDNEITLFKDYKQVTEELAAHKIQLALFTGYELAWAQAGHPKFKPLAIAVNEHPYRYVYVVVRSDSKATDFASLQGQSIALPRGNYNRLFVDQEVKATGKDAKTFFSKVSVSDNVEDALDDVVDGVAGAAAVNQVSLEAYKQRKPGRFTRLRELMHSPALPPPTMVYEEGTLDEATLKSFRDGLINAKNKEQGKLLLTLYKLTGFEAVPKDFESVVHETFKRFPPPEKQ